MCLTIVYSIVIEHSLLSTDLQVQCIAKRLVLRLKSTAENNIFFGTLGYFACSLNTMYIVQSEKPSFYSN